MKHLTASKRYFTIYSFTLSTKNFQASICAYTLILLSCENQVNPFSLVDLTLSWKFG